VIRFPMSVERVLDGDTYLQQKAWLVLPLPPEFFIVDEAMITVGKVKIRIKDYVAPERNQVGGSAATTDGQRLLIGSDVASPGNLYVTPYQDRMSFERFVADAWVGDRLYREIMVELGHGSYEQFYLQSVTSVGADGREQRGSQWGYYKDGRFKPV
jgi:endonuclease YncB( thermonuclease family)